MSRFVLHPAFSNAEGHKRLVSLAREWGDFAPDLADLRTEDAAGLAGAILWKEFGAWFAAICAEFRIDAYCAARRLRLISRPHVVHICAAWLW